MKKVLRFLLLIPISAATLFLIYPILHELGHALLTWIFGGRISSFALTPLPHIESELPYDAPEKTAIISLAGLSIPLLFSVPFLNFRAYKGFTIMLVLLITAIASIIELCIALQYTMGEIVAGDDIVLFLTFSGVSPLWAYAYCAATCLASLAGIAYMQPLQILEGLATNQKQ